MKKRGTGEHEVVLLAAQGTDLPPEEIVALCEERVRALVAEACLWRGDGDSRKWKPGDYNILIFETTAAVDASLYVQFWSEPMEPVEWEVSSGHANPGALPLIGEQAQQKLRGLAFEIGGKARNFRKTVTIANVGDVQAVARETLQIFIDALGYRGRTPLVARSSRSTRAEQGWTNRSLTPEDAQKMLRHAGRLAEKAGGFDVPVLNVEHEGVKYTAVLYGRIGEQNLYDCIDLRFYLGRARRSDLRRLNDANASYRNVKAYVDEDATAWLVQSITTIGGLTEESFVTLVEQFEQVLQDPKIKQLASALQREAEGGKRQAEGGSGKHSGAEVIH